MKQSILAFIENVTKEGSADFVPSAARVAVFDNDGTLWAEQPIYRHDGVRSPVGIKVLGPHSSRSHDALNGAIPYTQFSRYRTHTLPLLP